MTEDVLASDSTAIAQSEGGKVSTSIRYSMPASYANYIASLLEWDENVKRSDVRREMIFALALKVKLIPTDFPSEKQVRQRVTSMKYHRKKKRTV